MKAFVSTIFYMASLVFFISAILWSAVEHEELIGAVHFICFLLCLMYVEIRKLNP